MHTLGACAAELAKVSFQGKAAETIHVTQSEGEKGRASRLLIAVYSSYPQNLKFLRGSCRMGKVIFVRHRAKNRNTKALKH
jgi:hypothetical protein